MKAQRPSLGQRALLLLTVDEFWSLDAHTWTAQRPPYVFQALPPVHLPSTSPLHRQTASGPPPWAHKRYEYDIPEDAAAVPGIVLRMDYSKGSNDTWAGFCSTLRDTERDFFADRALNNLTPGDGGDGDVEMPSGTSEEGSEDDDASGTDDLSSPALLARFADVARASETS